jgi:hypothetical protein
MASTEFTWQKERRRADTAGGVAVRGFGPVGSYTLWLPTPEVSRRVKFVGGKPTMEIVQAAGFDEELQRLRDHVVKSIETVALIAGGRVVLRFPLMLLQYASALIVRHYNVTDAELEMLLPIVGEMPWVDQIVTHAIGGEQNAKLLAKFAQATGTPAVTAPDGSDGIEIEVGNENG